MKASGRSVFGAFKRAYSAQAQTARTLEKASLPKQQPKVTKLGNGLIVASVENYSPLSRVALLYNAGPRFEATNQKGLTHFLRNAVNLSTEKSTAFGVTRNIQQMGGSISCTTNREQMIYSLVCLRNNWEDGAQFLSHVATQPAFRTWELAEASGRTKFDLAILEENPQAQLAEAIHAAAYRNGLGNSLYSPDHRVGSYSPDQLQDFVSTHYTSSNAAVIGVGVDHDDLVIFAKELKLKNNPAPAFPSSKYTGAQVRVETNSPLVHAAVVTEGVGMASTDLFSLYVLQKVMGTGLFVKYGSDGVSSKVAQAATKVAKNPCAATCINTTYTDSGLFGFQVVAQADEVDKVIRSAAAAFGDATKGSITDADVQRAKTQLTAAWTMELENPDMFLADFGIQALMGGHVISMEEAVVLVDKVTTADVQNIAKKIINGKPSMAAVGDLSKTPYLEEVF